jgi:hypothetical protein
MKTLNEAQKKTYRKKKKKSKDGSQVEFVEPSDVVEEVCKKPEMDSEISLKFIDIENLKDGDCLELSTSICLFTDLEKYGDLRRTRCMSKFGNEAECLPSPTFQESCTSSLDNERQSMLQGEASAEGTFDSCLENQTRTEELKLQPLTGVNMMARTFQHSLLETSSIATKIISSVIAATENVTIHGDEDACRFFKPDQERSENIRTDRMDLIKAARERLYYFEDTDESDSDVDDGVTSRNISSTKVCTNVGVIPKEFRSTFRCNAPSTDIGCTKLAANQFFATPTVDLIAWDAWQVRWIRF